MYHSEFLAGVSPLWRVKTWPGWLLPSFLHWIRGSLVFHRHPRWRDMLESGDYATVRDLAKAEAINESYLGRVLRLTLLSPTVCTENLI